MAQILLQLRMPRRHANRIPVGGPIILRRRVLDRHERPRRRRRVQDRPRRPAAVAHGQPFDVRSQIVLVALAFSRWRRARRGMRVRGKRVAPEGPAPQSSSDVVREGVPAME